jgi:hypothetical protein
MRIKILISILGIVGLLLSRNVPVTQFIFNVVNKVKILNV